MSDARLDPTRLVHPDIAEPLSVAAIGDRMGRPFRNGRPPRSWKSDNLRRIAFDGFDLTYLCGRNFELDFDTRGHLIDFNYGDGTSIMRVNGGREEPWRFRRYATSFAPLGTDLYRRALESPAHDDRTRLIGLTIAPEYVDGLVYDILDGRRPSFVEMSPPERWPRMDRVQSGMLALFEAPHLFSRLTAEALANDAIMRGLMRWSSIGNRLSATRFVTDDQSVTRAVDFIAANLTKPIKLSDIARAAERDTTILIHAFKLANGRTPYEYLLASRVDAAKHDLRASSLGVAAIARRYCFGSPSHFSTTFRKFTGVSPSAYRGDVRK